MDATNSNMIELVAFNEKLSQLRALIEKARGEEEVAYGNVHGLQIRLLDAIARGDDAATQTMEARYSEVEDAWRGAALYTAELRAELQHTISSRHEEEDKKKQELQEVVANPAQRALAMATNSMVPGADPRRGLYSAATRVAYASTHGTSVNSDKLVVKAANGALPARGLLVNTFPVVAHQEYLPISDGQIRQHFERLALDEQSAARKSRAHFEGGADGENGENLSSCGSSSTAPPMAAGLGLQTVVRYFDDQDRLGVPVDAMVWVTRNLAKFRPTIPGRRPRIHVEEEPPSPSPVVDNSTQHRSDDAEECQQLEDGDGVNAALPPSPEEEETESRVSFDQFAYLVTRWSQQ